MLLAVKLQEEIITWKHRLLKGVFIFGNGVGNIHVYASKVQFLKI